MTTTLGITPDGSDSTLAAQWLEEAEETGDSDAYTRWHRDPRVSWSVPLDVYLMVNGRRTDAYYATSFDVSLRGVGFNCRYAIPPYTTVLVCRSGEMAGVCGMTRNITESLSGFSIGVEFRAETQAATQSRSSMAG